jgi:hypothetical protein
MCDVRDRLATQHSPTAWPSVQLLSDAAATVTCSPVDALSDRQYACKALKCCLEASIQWLCLGQCCDMACSPVPLGPSGSSGYTHQ